MINIKEKIKQFRKFLITIILFLSCSFGIWIFIFLCIFIISIFGNGCDNVVNGVCEVSKSKDALISNSILPTLVVSFPLAFLLYKKFRKMFYLISVPSFLFGIVVALSR